MFFAGIDLYFHFLSYWPVGDCHYAYQQRFDRPIHRISNHSITEWIETHDCVCRIFAERGSDSHRLINLSAENENIDWDLQKTSKMTRIVETLRERSDKKSVAKRPYNYADFCRNPRFCVGKTGFLILNIFKMPARFSKCDFRIPGQILDFKKKIEKIFFCFEIEKKSRKVRNLEKVENFRIFKDFQWVSLVIY